MSSSQMILIAIYAAGAVVGLVCWLPYYFGNRRWIRGLLREHREQYDQTVAQYQRVVSLKDEVSDAKVAVAAKAGEVARLVQERGVLQAQVGKQKSTIASLEAERTRLAEERDTVTQSLERTQVEILRLKNEAAELQTTFAADSAQWAEERTRVTQQLEKAESRLRELSASLAGTEGALNEAKCECDRLQKLLDSQTADSTDEMVNLKHQLTAAETRVREHSESLATALSDVSVSAAEILSLKELLAAARHLASEKFTEAESLRKSLEDAQSRAAVQERRIFELDSMIGVLSEQFQQAQANLDAATGEVSGRDEKIASLESEIADTDSNIRSLRTNIADLQRRLRNDRLGAQRPALNWLGNPPHITIGLDFGTYSTKVVFRERNSAKAWVLHWDEPSTGYPSFAAPSLVRVDDKRVYFGSEALRRREGWLFRSLKMSLLPVHEKAKKNGDVDELSPTLVVLYLAWVLQTIEMILKVGPAKISLNVGAPLKRAGGEDVKNLYLRVINAAWKLSFGDNKTPIDQGIPLDEKLSKRVYQLLAEKTPGREERSFEVLPETFCPLVSLSHDPRQWSTGMVMVVDMGAGTTELSISSTTNITSDYPIQCYFDQSFDLGGDRFADNDSTPIPFDRHSQGEKELVDQFMQKIESVWKKGFQYGLDEPHAEKQKWNQLRIIKVGGGLQRRTLNSRIDTMKHPPSMNAILDPTRQCKAFWHNPSELKFWDLNATEPIAHPALLSVAHGLSIHRGLWPQTVEPIDGDPPVVDAPAEPDPLKPWYL